MTDPVYAEDINYWKTGQRSADTWIDMAINEIERAGGELANEAYGRDATGRAAYLVDFTFGRDRFRVVWPVLPTRSERLVDQKAARVQAATCLYHDIKAKAVSAKVHGVRAAFFQFLQLADGRTMSEVATPDLGDLLPRLLTGAS